MYPLRIPRPTGMWFSEVLAPFNTLGKSFPSSGEAVLLQGLEIWGQAGLQLWGWKPCSRAAAAQPWLWVIYLAIGISSISWKFIKTSPLQNQAFAEPTVWSPKANQPWIFTGRTDAVAEAPILWPPDAKSQLTGKDCDAGKDWGQEENKATEDEMVGWHHQLDGHEFEQTVGDSEG